MAGFEQEATELAEELIVCYLCFLLIISTSTL
jgi:hypothetical protein